MWGMTMDTHLYTGPSVVRWFRCWWITAETSVWGISQAGHRYTRHVGVTYCPVSRLWWITWQMSTLGMRGERWAFEDGRTLRHAWTIEFPWYPAFRSEKAFCKLCKCTLNPKLSALRDHSTTVRHKANTPKNDCIQTTSKPREYRVPVKGRPINTDQRKAELRLSVAIASHCAIVAVYHIDKVVQDLGKGSILACIKLHRTKCTDLLKNVIAPCFKEELVQDSKEKPYALVVDESTDISVY